MTAELHVLRRGSLGEWSSIEIAETRIPMRSVTWHQLQFSLQHRIPEPFTLKLEIEGALGATIGAAADAVQIVIKVQTRTRIGSLSVNGFATLQSLATALERLVRAMSSNEPAAVMKSPYTR